MREDAVEQVVELTLRLTRVMRSDYVMTWLHTPGIDALGGERPIDLITRGHIGAVSRLVSALESPGAA